jgi:hypothetical protein
MSGCGDESDARRLHSPDRRQTGLIMGNAGVRPLGGQVLPGFECVGLRFLMSKSRGQIRRVQCSEATPQRC